MRIGQRLVDLLHRARRQARGEQAVAQRLGLVLAEHGGEFGTQRVAVGDAVLVAGKARIGAEFGLADLLGELAEGAVIADADEDVVGLGREDRIGHEVGMLVAGQRRRLAMHEIIRGVRMHDGETGLVQRGFQELAMARTLPLRQRHQNADRGIEAGPMSTSGTPIRIGPLSGEPVAAIMPVMAWMMAS